MLFVVCKSKSGCMGYNTVAAVMPVQVVVLSKVRGGDHSLSAGAPPTEEMRTVIKWAPPAASVEPLLLQVLH